MYPFAWVDQDDPEMLSILNSVLDRYRSKRGNENLFRFELSVIFVAFEIATGEPRRHKIVLNAQITSDLIDNINESAQNYIRKYKTSFRGDLVQFIVFEYRSEDSKYSRAMSGQIRLSDL